MKETTKEKLERAYKLIKEVDEEISESFLGMQHGSPEFRTNQRLSNGAYRVIRSIESLKEEIE
jgi:hypothetical protein